jgi:hypothetical protein
MTTTTRSTGSVAELAGHPAKDDLSRLRPRRHGFLRRTSRRRVPGCRALSLSGFGDVSSQFASTTCRSASRRRGRAALGRRRIVEGSLGAVGDGRSIKKEGRQKRRPQWAPAVVLSGVQFEGQSDRGRTEEARTPTQVEELAREHPQFRRVIREGRGRCGPLTPL